MSYHFLNIVLLHLNLQPLPHVLYTDMNKLAIALNIICLKFFWSLLKVVELEDLIWHVSYKLELLKLVK